MSPLLEIKDLCIDYTVAGNFGKTRKFRALEGVSLTIEKGQTLGLVGESGSGKSTLGKAICRLLGPSYGQILFEGRDIFKLRGAGLQAYRRGLSMIFQDPSDSLDPKMTVKDIISEPLEIHHIPQRREHIAELLEAVGLPQEVADKFPHELSGGMRQRVGIARALALKPKLIICDEPVSALDLSIQSQIINLLLKLQRELGLSYLFISHDLRLVRHFSDQIAVLKSGHLVEYGPATEVYSSPKADYTRELLASLPKF
jgi:ABC-type oligopeptide transport system ATPase subunit